MNLNNSPDNLKKQIKQSISYQRLLIQLRPLEATVEKDSKAIQSQIDKLSTVKTQKEFDDLTGSIQRMLDKLKGLSHVSKDTKKAIQELSVSFTKAKLDSARNVEAEEASRKAAEEARMMQEENAKIYAEAEDSIRQMLKVEQTQNANNEFQYQRVCHFL